MQTIIQMKSKQTHPTPQNHIIKFPHTLCKNTQATIFFTSSKFHSIPTLILFPSSLCSSSHKLMATATTHKWLTHFSNIKHSNIKRQHQHQHQQQHPLYFIHRHVMILLLLSLIFLHLSSKLYVRCYSNT